MSRSDDIVGYTYRAENYTPAGLIERMVRDGNLSPAARDMSAEDVLDQHAGACAIDRYEEHTFDSNEFPKVIFVYHMAAEPGRGLVNEFGVYVDADGEPLRFGEDGEVIR